jgi:photosystem II stability/assembly factor-like uncharacterized protein
MTKRSLAVAALLAAACGRSASDTPPPPRPATLAFAIQPADASSSVAIAPAVKVELRDASGARVPGATDAVTLAIAAGPAGATLSGTTTAAAVDGLATFADLSIAKAGTGFTLLATSGTLTAATSAAFAVSPGPAAKLAFSTQPSSGRSTVPSSPAIAVDVLDAAGNLVAGATTSVTLAVAAGPAVARLTGTTSVAAVGGRATFATAALDAAGTYTLAARATGLTSATSTSFSLSDAWTPVGPDGGYLSRLAVHPSTPATLLAAAGPAGLWISNDAAATWTQVPLPGKAGADGVRFGTGSPAELWAWGSDGLWHSPDTGATWSSVTPPRLLTYGPVVVEPGTGVAFTSGWDGAAYELLRSADQGATWAAVTPALPGGTAPWTLGVSSDGTLWVNTANGVYRLASGGAAWSAAGTGPGGTAPGNLYGFAFHPTDPSKAWAGTYSNVLATADGGATWTAQHLNGSTVFDVLVDGASATPVLYAATFGSGVWRSPDGGTTWAPTGALGADSAKALAGGGAAIYLGTESGAWKSADAGATWGRASAGLRAATPVTLAFQPGATGLLLAGANGEVFRSTDGGASWTRSQVALGDFHQRIAFDPAAPSHAFSAAGYHGILTTTDAGLTWSPATGTAGMAMYVTVGGGTPSAVWALTSTGVYRSTDGGTTFTSAWGSLPATATVSALLADPSSALVAYAGLSDPTPANGGVYSTGDGGVTWTKAAGSPGVYSNSHFEVVASSPSVIWLEDSGGPYRSTDGAATWTSVYPSNAGGQLWGLGSDPSNALRCFMGSYKFGAYLTTDGGASWTQVRRGLTPEVNRVVVDPANPLTVYALGGGLYRSTTGGL